MDKKMLIRSKQPNLKVSYFGVPRYEIHFQNTEPVSVPEDIGRHLIASNASFEEVKGSVSESVKEDDAFEEELRKIKGVGAKTAKDIYAVFPKKEMLINAIKTKKHIPFDDKVAEILIKNYGGEQ